MHTPQRRNGQGTSSPPMRFDWNEVTPLVLDGTLFVVDRKMSYSLGKFASISTADIGDVM